jgi:hypothetical protein
MSSLVASEKSSPLGLSGLGSASASPLAGFAHAVALSVGDDHVGVVEEAVDE